MGAISGVIGPRELCYARVEVAPPPRERLPDRRVVNAIVDPGAEGTVVSERVASEMRLPVVDSRVVALGFGEPVVCAVAAGTLVLLGDDEATRQDVYTVAAPFIVASGDLPRGYEILLGADAFQDGP